MKQSILIIFIILSNLIAFGQSREQLISEIEATRTRIFNGFEVFLDPAKTLESRVNAIGTFSGIYDEGQIVKVAALVFNPKEAPVIRAAALTSLTDQVSKDKRLWDQVITWVQAPAYGKELREAALATLENLSFSFITQVENRQETINTFRNLTRDSDIRFRRFALGYLSAHGDSFAQSLLIDQLDKNRTDLVPTAEAISLLALNIHGDYLPTVNSVFQSPPDTASLVQGLLVLGKYAPAKEKIVSLFTNKKIKKRIRELALATLLNSYPDEADYLSVTVLNDKAEPEDFKILIMMNTMYKRRAEWARYKKNGPDTLHEIIKNMAESSVYPQLQKTAEEYLEMVQVVYE